MGKYYGLGIVIILSLFAGCNSGPQSPLSTIPMILIDHIEENGETKVFVHGIDDHLFSNITLQINEKTLTENLTYELHIPTFLKEFMLNVTVWDALKHYEYTGNFTLLSEDEEIKMEITDLNHKEPIEESLPYTIIMERKE